MNSDKHIVSVPMEDYERMMRGFARYEYVRTLTPQGFATLWELCTKDGMVFDKQVDAEILSEVRKNHERRLRESTGPGWREP